MKFEKQFYFKKLNDYFLAFSDKDLSTLSELLSDDACLIDWEIEVEGKEAFLNANKEIFNKCEKIIIYRNTFFYGEIFQQIESTNKNFDTFFCPILINVDGNMLKVLDSISFNEEGKICRVIAYRQ